MSAAQAHAGAGANASGQGDKPWMLDLLLLSALWGASFAFIRIGSVEFGALPAATVRVAVAALALLPLLLARGLGPQLRQHWRATLVVGVTNSGLPFALFCYAVLSISGGLAAVLNATTPMFGALIAWAWFGDRPDASRLVGLVIGFAGVALLTGHSAGLHGGGGNWAALWAVLACLVAALSYGVSASYARRFLADVPPLVTATGSQIGATVFLALPTVLLWPAQAPSFKAWATMIAIGVACTALAYILYFRIVAHAGPARALTVTFLVPVFAMVYGALFLHEAVTAWTLGCAAVIVMGVALSTGLVRLGRRKGSAAAAKG